MNRDRGPEVPPLAVDWIQPECSAGVDLACVRCDLNGLVERRSETYVDEEWDVDLDDQAEMIEWLRRSVGTVYTRFVQSDLEANRAEE